MKLMSIFIVICSFTFCSDFQKCSAQIISIPSNKNTISFSSILAIDSLANAYLFSTQYFHPKRKNRIITFKFNDNYVFIDTLIEGFKDYPRIVFNPNLFHFRYSDTTVKTFLLFEHDTILTIFRYPTIHGIEYLNNKNILFINENRLTGFRSLEDLRTPLGYFLYESDSFKLINKAQFSPPLQFYYYKGLLVSKNYWAVVFDTYSAGLKALQDFKPLISDTLIKYYTQNFEDSKFYQVSIYDNNGNFLKYQFIYEPNIVIKKQGECFLTLSNNKKKISIWKMDEKEINYRKEHTISSSGLNVLDYAYYDNNIYLLLGNTLKDRVNLKKIDLINKTVKDIELQYFDHIEVNSTGIYLNYESNSKGSASASMKALKHKNLFNLQQEDLSKFRILMYFDDVLARIDFDAFDVKVSNPQNSILEIDYEKQTMLYSNYIIPCKINNKPQVWLCYYKDTMGNMLFSGTSIRVGELGFFYLNDKQALWDRRTGEVYYNIVDLKTALEKSLYLWSATSKLARIYGN